MAKQRGGRRTLGASLLGVVVVVAGLTSAAQGAVIDNKTFTVDVRGTDTGAVPDVHSGDRDAALTIRVTNTAASQTLNSANVTVPDLYAVTAAPADDEPGGPVLELRDLAIRPGTYREFSVTVEVLTCIPAIPPAFKATAKQSNNYSGVGNDFYLEAPSDLQVNALGSCGLSFVDQPASAERTAPITSVPFAPAGQAVTVSIDDAGGTGRATSSSATVGLAAANPSVPAPALGGTTSVAAVDGLATFSPGPTQGVSAFGYTLVATSPGLVTSPDSETFDIVDDQVNCPANQACVGNASASKGAQAVTVSFGTGATSTNLLVSIDAADAPAFECAGYPRPSGTFVSQFGFSGDGGGDRFGSMATLIPNATRPLNSYQACWAAPYPFVTSSGAPAGVQGTKPGTSDPLYVGILPDCAKRGVVKRPCVSGRSYDRASRAVTVTVSSTGADPWRY